MLCNSPSVEQGSVSNVFWLLNSCSIASAGAAWSLGSSTDGKARLHPFDPQACSTSVIASNPARQPQLSIQTCKGLHQAQPPLQHCELLWPHSSREKADPNLQNPAPSIHIGMEPILRVVFGFFVLAYLVGGWEGMGALMPFSWSL